MEEFNRFEIVLCRPAESGNIGAACRAMKTMGFSRLTVVAPERPVQEDAVRTMAVHAADVFDSSRRTETLPAAIGECGLAVGMTRRRGRKRKAFSLTVQEFAAMAWSRPGRTAIVFGNERTGLSGPELEACQMAIHIPTAPEFTSLNLAQAVMVLCWELARNRPDALSSGTEPVGTAALALGADEIVQGLERMGYFRLKGQEEHCALLRDLLARASPSASEFTAFKAIFRKCEGLWRAASDGGD